MASGNSGRLDFCYVLSRWLQTIPRVSQRTAETVVAEVGPETGPFSTANHPAAAADGRLELYKVSLRCDNPEARYPHQFPLDPTQIEVKDMFKAAGGP